MSFEANWKKLNYNPLGYLELSSRLMELSELSVFVNYRPPINCLIEDHLSLFCSSDRMTDFNVISRIGSGGFGHVFLVSLKSDSRRSRSVNDDDVGADNQSVDSLIANSSIDVDDVFAMKVIEKVKLPALTCGQYYKHVCA